MTQPSAKKEKPAPWVAAPGQRARVAELPADTLLTREEVAAWLALKHPRQVERLKVPEIYLAHRTVRYRKSAVEAWLAVPRPRPVRKLRQKEAA